MKVIVGVDLGSTTSKALVLDEDDRIVGKGITNSRSNYDVAVDLARTEAFVETRFDFLRERFSEAGFPPTLVQAFLARLGIEFRVAQHLRQVDWLERALLSSRLVVLDLGERAEVAHAHAEILSRMRALARDHIEAAPKGATFFRDLATSDYMDSAHEISKAGGPGFQRLANLFDVSIIQVENAGVDLSFEGNVGRAVGEAAVRCPGLSESEIDRVRALVESAAAEPIEVVASVGTGYGRARLPFPKDHIRSEILCHGLGAHRMFGNTRTVLDIGGQDTKAIQVDAQGIVTSFQMNDRCAAGCGRYLGYIADEMNLGLHELGPMAEKSCNTVKINSTCTVFAGAELRDRLTMGQKREDILAGLHRAIILRALSLLARSGGVDNEFTFTGGVAKNIAAVNALTTLIHENYGELTMNVSPDSIYTGALGAATFGYRDAFVHREAA